MLGFSRKQDVPFAVLHKTAAGKASAKVRPLTSV